MTLKQPKKRTILAALIAFSYMLSGCTPGQTGGNLDERIRQSFEELPGFTSEVKILSDLGQSTLEFAGQYEYNKEDNDKLTLSTPEALAGIVITIAGESADNMTVQYEDTVLDTGLPARFGATPADVIPLLLYALRTDVPQEAWEETVGGVKMIAARYETEDEQGKITRQIWLTRDSLRPAYAECFADGNRVLQVFFSTYE